MKLAPPMISVVPLEPYTVRCAFADGEVRDVDIEPVLFLDGDSHTPTWPGGVDLDREVSYGLYPSASTPCAHTSTPQRV